ncbi:hypothetical protein F5X99DRAFT_410611 [Biscogniauxia marginata]|nr:hypothetical protein F5X99DRAFT_410611 [Biscogniauxia marginata]
MPSQIAAPIPVTPPRKNVRLLTTPDLFASLSESLASKEKSRATPVRSIQERDWDVPAPPPPSPIVITMPAIKQRRKASTKPKATPTQQPASSSIASFARVSKTISNPGVKKEQTSTPKKDVKLEAITPASRKRKAVATVDDDSSADERPGKLVLPLSTPSKAATAAVHPTKRRRGRPSKKAQPEPTPRERVRSPSVTGSDESAVDTGSLLKQLRLESSPSRCSSPLTANTSIADPDVSDNEPANPHRLLDEVLSLIGLHSALLKTLTLHYAHNGTDVPADLRVLCPNIARAWGKKKVTAAEVRICIGVLNGTSRPDSKNLFSLLNYGRGKVCIEIDPAHGSSPLDEKKLNAQFSDNVRSLWTQYLTANGTSADASAFAATLPKAPVTLCESVVKAAPVLAKGQKRLEEFKSGLAAKKQEKESSSSSPPQPKQNQTPAAAPAGDVPMANASGPKMSLLDRIRHKSLQKAALAAAGLSPAQLARRAALQRVEEVASLVGMLSRASSDPGSRVSFPMAAMVEKLKDSFRMGISREEGAACVRLLAAEVAPEWVRVVVVGKRENVVIETDAQVSKAEVARRVAAVMERD